MPYSPEAATSLSNSYRTYIQQASPEQKANIETMLLEVTSVKDLRNVQLWGGGVQHSETS